MIPDIANLKRLRKTHARCIIPIYTPGVGPLAFPVTPRTIRLMKGYGRNSVLYHVYKQSLKTVLAWTTLTTTIHYLRRHDKATHRGARPPEHSNVDDADAAAMTTTLAEESRAKD